MSILTEPLPLGWFSAGVLVAIAAGALWRWWCERRAERGGPLDAHAKARAAFQPPAVAPDIYAGRLVSLCLRSRTVFPFVGGQVPVHAIWRGTAEGLREALLAPDSRLYFGERREVPHPEALEHRLTSMMRGGVGRVRVEVESITPEGVRTWRLTLGGGAFTPPAFPQPPRQT